MATKASCEFAHVRVKMAECDMLPPLQPCKSQAWTVLAKQDGTYREVWRAGIEHAGNNSFYACTSLLQRRRLDDAPTVDELETRDSLEPRLACTASAVTSLQSPVSSIVPSSALRLPKQCAAHSAPDGLGAPSSAAASSGPYRASRFSGIQPTLGIASGGGGSA